MPPDVPSLATPAPSQPAAAAQPAPTPGAAPPNPAATAAPDGVSKPDQTTKPDWLGEAHWDPEQGAIKPEFGAHYAEIAKFHQEQSALLATVPDEPAKYPLDLPKDLKLPEGFEFKLDPKDPMVGKAQAIAHKHRIAPAVLSDFIGLQAELRAAEDTAFNAMLAEQQKALGPDKDARISALGAQLTAAAGEDVSKTLIGLIATAKGIMALEQLAARITTQGAIPINGNGHANGHDTPPASQVPLERRWYGAPQQKAN